MKKTALLALTTLAIILAISACAPRPKPALVARTEPLWFGLHVLAEKGPAAEALLAELPALAKAGINVLIFEVDYNYEFVSHPELRGDAPISRETVKKIVGLCRDLNIRLIPEFQSLGHQSWAEKTHPLLVKYPHLDESPGQVPREQGHRPLGDGVLSAGAGARSIRRSTRSSSRCTTRSWRSSRPTPCTSGWTKSSSSATPIVRDAPVSRRRSSSPGRSTTPTTTSSE